MTISKICKKPKSTQMSASVQSEIASPMKVYSSLLFKDNSQNGQKASQDLNENLDFTVIVKPACLMKNEEQITNLQTHFNLKKDQLNDKLKQQSLKLSAHSPSVTEKSIFEEIHKNNCLIGYSRSRTFAVNSNDPYQDNMDHLESIDFDKALVNLKGQVVSRQSVVAIIDTGVDIHHPDLKNSLWTNPGEQGNGKETNGIDDDGNGYIDDVVGYDMANNDNNPTPKYSNDLHGTHVAGLAAASYNNQEGIHGTGIHSKIMSVKVFADGVNGADNSDIENAIRYAVDNGAHVINLSLGGFGYTPSTYSALLYASQNNVSIVAAAGNSNVKISNDVNSSKFFTPASLSAYIPSMITVGSVDSINNGISSFSNYSTSVVNLAAPGAHNSSTGQGVLSTLPQNNYGRLSGTSMASPVAAGIFALVRNLLKEKVSALQLKSIILKNSTSSSYLSSYIYEGKIINAKKLFDKVLAINEEYSSNEEAPEEIETPEAPRNDEDLFEDDNSEDNDDSNEEETPEIDPPSNEDRDEDILEDEVPEIDSPRNDDPILEDEDQRSQPEPDLENEIDEDNNEEIEKPENDSPIKIPRKEDKDNDSSQLC